MQWERNQVKRIVKALLALLARYPAAVAAVLNVAVALAARFGFHASATELAVIVSAVAAILGAYVHSRVSPVKSAASPDKAVAPK